MVTRRQIQLSRNNFTLLEQMGGFRGEILGQIVLPFQEISPDTALIDIFGS